MEGGGDGVRHRQPLLTSPGMQGERAAAAGVGRRHLITVRGEHARRRAVHLPEEHALNAARQQSDPRALRAGGRRLAWRPDRLAPRRRELAEGAERREPRERQRGAHHPRPREHGERERAQGALRQRPAHLLLDALARELDQPVVLHARRARGQAGHAAEALVEVLGDGGVQLDPALDRLLHQPDATARRVHLLVPELVRRAGRQAEAAVHAVADQHRVH